MVGHEYPSIKRKLARKKAQEFLNNICNGLSPIITKQDRKAKELEDNTATFEALARDWLDTKLNRWGADKTI